MAGELYDIIYYHQEGQKALEEKKYIYAASMFKLCHDKFQNAESHFLCDSTISLGNDAAEKYDMIVTTYLNDEGFDRIEYEK
jgi:hypothetical protein